MLIINKPETGNPSKIFAKSVSGATLLKTMDVTPLPLHGHWTTVGCSNAKRSPLQKLWTKDSGVSFVISYSFVLFSQMPQLKYVHM